MNEDYAEKDVKFVKIFYQNTAMTTCRYHTYKKMHPICHGFTFVHA